MKRTVLAFIVLMFLFTLPNKSFAQKKKPKAKTDPTLTPSKKQKKVKKKIVKRKKRAAESRQMDYATAQQLIWRRKIV